MFSLIITTLSLVLTVGLATATVVYVNAGVLAGEREAQKIKSGFIAYVRAAENLERLGAGPPGSLADFETELGMTPPPLPLDGQWVLNASDTLEGHPAVRLCAVFPRETNGLLAATVAALPAESVDLGVDCTGHTINPDRAVGVYLWVGDRAARF